MNEGLQEREPLWVPADAILSIHEIALANLWRHVGHA